MKKKKLVPDPICVQICVNDRPVAVIFGKASLNVNNLLMFLSKSEIGDCLNFYELDNEEGLKYADWLMHSDYIDPKLCAYEFEEKE